MIYHNHHIVPRHAGGTDEASNIERLLIEDHALAHKKLYELNGKWQDKIAWKMLSGQITKIKRDGPYVMSESHKKKISVATTGHKKTDEHIKKINDTKRANGSTGNRGGTKGYKMSMKARENMKKKKIRTALCINGINYDSFTAATEILSMNSGLINYRVKSKAPQWCEWRVR